jgi:hypothetical protein
MTTPPGHFHLHWRTTQAHAHRCRGRRSHKCRTPPAFGKVIPLIPLIPQSPRQTNPLGFTRLGDLTRTFLKKKADTSGVRRADR